MSTDQDHIYYSEQCKCLQSKSQYQRANVSLIKEAWKHKALQSEMKHRSKLNCSKINSFGRETGHET